MGRDFIVEDTLNDYFSELVEEDPTIISDAKRMQARARESRPTVSNRKVPLGMQLGGTMRKMGEIPIRLWRADERLRPHLKSDERARDLLRRFPALTVEGV